MKRKTIKWLSILCVLMAGKHAIASDRTDFVLSDEHAGSIAIGMTPKQVEDIVGKSVMKRVELRSGGMIRPALNVYATAEQVGQPLLVLELNGEEVNRIIVHDPRYKTEEGIAIGSSADELRDTYGHGQYINGDEGFYGMVYSDFGMSFEMSLGTAPVVTSIRVDR